MYSFVAENNVSHGKRKGAKFKYLKVLEWFAFNHFQNNPNVCFKLGFDLTFYNDNNCDTL